MYENTFNTEIKETLTQWAKTGDKSDIEIIRYLNSKIPGLNILEDSTLTFCSCGYPVGYRIQHYSRWIKAILREEVDFRSYRIYYSCPICKQDLFEDSSSEEDRSYQEPEFPR